MKRDFRRRKQGAAPSFSVSNESADSWCRHGRHYFIWQRTSISITSSSPAWRVPTGFRWRESGRRAESDSGGDGLLANPRSRPTPLSAFRTPTSESVGWLLLLFATEKQRKRKSFLVYFWGQKYQKPPHVVFRGSVRSAALHGARKIKPMRHPVTDAPQPAPSFSASNESADLLCRQRRHYYTMRSGSPYQLTCPARLRLRVTFVSQNQPPSQLHFFFFRKAIPDLVPMAKKRTEG